MSDQSDKSNWESILGQFHKWSPKEKKAIASSVTANSKWPESPLNLAMVKSLGGGTQMSRGVSGSSKNSRN